MKKFYLSLARLLVNVANYGPYLTKSANMTKEGFSILSPRANSEMSENHYQKGLYSSRQGSYLEFYGCLL